MILSFPEVCRGVYVGSGTMPDGFNVQVDPTGEMTPAITSESYDTIIIEQDQFDAMLASETWNGVRNILFECGVTVTGAFAVPATVRTIEFNNYMFTINCETTQTYTYDFGGSAIRNMNIFIQQGNVVFANIDGVYNCRVVTPPRNVEDETMRQITISNSKNIYEFQFSSNSNSFVTEGVQLLNCTYIYNCSMAHSDCDAISGIRNSKYLGGCEVTGNSLTCFASCSYIVNCCASINDLGTCFYNCSYLSNCSASRTASDNSSAFSGTTIACDTDSCLEVVS